MDCFKSTSDEYETPYELNYYSSVENLKTIDIEKILSTIPEDLESELSTVINISSNESLSLNPCERKEVKTGFLLRTFLPISHSLLFEGFANNLGVQSENKCVTPLIEKEFTVFINNYSSKTVRIPSRMPLGKLIIKSNK
jgi:hypothetical protein